MKNYLKIAIVIFIVYLAYKYYVENYTESGKQKKAINEAETRSIYESRAAELKSSFKSSGYNACNSYYQSGVYEWDRVASCKLQVDSDASATDWVQIAMNE